MKNKDLDPTRSPRSFLWQWPLIVYMWFARFPEDSLVPKYCQILWTGTFGSWWGLSSWLVDSLLLVVCSHGFPSVCVHGETENSHSPSSSYKGTKPIMEAPPSRPHRNLITSPKPHLLIWSYGGVELQHMNLGTYKHWVHNNWKQVITDSCHNCRDCCPGPNSLLVAVDGYQKNTPWK